MTEAGKPSRLDRLRSRHGRLDHMVRAVERYRACDGDFYAAGITYYTVLALFPVLMVGFAAGGFALSRQPHLLADLDNRIRNSVSGEFSQPLIDLMDSAINSRTSVGIAGLATAIWAGIGWMENLRKALSQMWHQRDKPVGLVLTKLSDLTAMVSAFLAIVTSVALTALGDPTLMHAALRSLGIPDLPVLDGGLRGLSLLTAFLVSWLLFTWMIARLPWEATGFHNAMRAGLIGAIGYEVFKQIASIYLRTVLKSPAAATFGPALGFMVFAYVTARLVLYSAAWAATSSEIATQRPIPTPLVDEPN